MSAACEPARSAGAAFRESLRSVQELVCQRNDVSRMIAECAMELAHVKQQEQNNEAEQDPGRSDPEVISVQFRSFQVRFEHIGLS